MNLTEEITAKISNVRHQIDTQTGEFYYSVVDVIDILDLSADPRNYWKVLKNRLKKGENKLVAECNQLKMKSSDSKYYLTDVVTHSTMLKIIELISPEKVATLEEFLNYIERKNDINKDINNLTNERLSITSYEEGEIQVDMYQKENLLFVKAMIAGVNPEDIFISATSKILTLKINRIRNENIDNYSFNYKELIYGKFERVINLPFEVDIDRVETNSSYGLLTIKLCILDKTRTKIIKVK